MIKHVADGDRTGLFGPFGHLWVRHTGQQQLSNLSDHLFIKMVHRPATTTQ